MDTLSISIIALVEGVTEFLPISSTGHMIIVSNWLGLSQGEAMKAFEVVIQIFAIFAILLFYRSKINFNAQVLWSKTLIAFVPIGVVGFLFAPFIKSLFSVTIVAWAFIIGGIALLWAEKIQKTVALKKEPPHTVEAISFKDAFKIGLFQVLALIPGTSRSGATIFGAMTLGIPRGISAEFSFLLAVPTMLAVTAHDVLKHYSAFSGIGWDKLALAGVITFISAYVSVKLFVMFLERFSIASFGWYRIIFGTILLAFVFL